MRMKLVLLIPCLFVVVGCGGEAPSTEQPAAEAPPTAPTEPPALDVAAEAIAGSVAFTEYRFTRTSYGFPAEGARLKGSQLEAVKNLQAAGWVDIDPDGDVTLSRKGGDDKHFIVRPNRSIDIVPLAKKEFVSADAAGNDEEGDVTIDFTWRWVPNEIHAAFTSGEIATRFDGDRKARATMYEGPDGWEILRIVKIESEAEGESGESGN